MLLPQLPVLPAVGVEWVLVHRMLVALPLLRLRLGPLLKRWVEANLPSETRRSHNSVAR